MKLNVDKKTLSTALAKISGVVEKRNTIPVLSNIYYKAEDNKLTLRATDLEIEATTSIEADVSEPGEGTVEADLLARVIKGMGSSPVSMSSDNGRLKVQSGKSVFDFATLPASEYPQLASTEYDVTFSVDADVLSDLFGDSSFAMSTEEVRYFLQGIYFHHTDDGITAVATDGTRLAKVWADSDDEFPSVIVPRKTVGELRKVLDTDDVLVSVSQHKIKFDIGDTVIVSKVIDGTYPDYTRVIPSNTPDTARVNAKEFHRAASLVSMVSDGKSKAIKLAIGNGVINISAGGGDHKSEDEIEASINGRDCKIGFNSKYLSDAMSVDEIDEVDICYNADEAMNPIVIKPVEGDGFLAVLMPMRAS